MAFYLHFILYIFFDAFVGFGNSLAFSSFSSFLCSLDGDDDDDDGKSMVCSNGVQCTSFTRAIWLYPKTPTIATMIMDTRAACASSPPVNFHFLAGLTHAW